MSLLLLQGHIDKCISEKYKKFQLLSKLLRGDNCLPLRNSNQLAMSMFTDTNKPEKPPSDEGEGSALQAPQDLELAGELTLYVGENMSIRRQQCVYMTVVWYK